MDVVLEAVKRERFGKNEAGRMRREGRLPGVLYGATAGRDALPIEVEPKALMKILRSESGANTLITLKVEGESPRVMLREYQLDPVTHQLLHADFYRVAMDKVITVTVPVTLRGEAPGVKQQGGLLDFVHRQVEVECLPTDIPEALEIDVSGLMLNQSLRLRDVAESVKWKPVSDLDLMLVHVVAPRAEAEPAAAEGETPAAAEPEVVKKGKGEKDEEAAK
ncbi:MAG TPA: 50S ribosomal protein L25 [Vicinamibacterales bacterium]|nr:50S ribosomal protein L25 [Vicinamibacterales bacterium]